MAVLAATTSSRLQMLGALRYRNFRLYWAANLGQALAMGMQFLIFGWLVLQMTNSASQLGLVIFLYGLPNLSMLLFGGIFADRINRRWLLISSQTTVTILITLAATLTLFQLISIWHLYAIAFMLGTIQGVNMPARMAIVPDIVDREDILNATSLNMAVFNSGRIIGPSIAGWVIEYAGLAHALYFNAFCYGIGVVFLIMMTGVKSQSKNQSNGSNILLDLWTGLRYMRATPIALTLVGLSFVFGFFGGAFLQIMPAFAKEVLKADAGSTGLLLSAVGVGSIVGNMILASLGNVSYKNWLLVGMILLFGITLFMVAWSPFYVITIGILFFLGIGFTGFISVGTTIFQLTTPPELRGRMMSMWLVGAATQFVGTWPLGVVADHYGWPISIGGGALLMLAVVVYLGLYRPTVRELRV